MVKEQFVGTWKLLSFECRTLGDQEFYPFGEDPIGLLTYDVAGHMSVQFMRSNRPSFVSYDPVKATPEELKFAFTGMGGYFGTYSVNEEEGTVIHHVIGCFFPNWENKDQKRYFNFSDGCLTLSTPPIMYDGQPVTSRLIWQRVA